MIKNGQADHHDKKIIIYLSGKNKATLNEISENTEYTKEWTRQKTKQLTKKNIITENPEDTPTTYQLNPKKIKIGYTTQKYQTPLLLILLTLITTILTTLAQITTQQYSLGAITSLTTIFLYYIYLILVEPEHKTVHIHKTNTIGIKNQHPPI